MPIIGTASSGSLYPNKTLLENQLNPPEGEKSEIESKLLNNKVEIWSKSAQDLPRLGKVILNGKTVVDTKKETSLKAEEVFDEILIRCNEDVETAKAVSNLFNQGLALKVKQEILIEKGCATRNDEGIASHIVSGKDKVYALEMDKENFKIVEEHLYQKVSPNARDVDSESTYFKAKMIISGKRVDLASRNAQKLDFKIAYTEETISESAAKKCNYFGTRAGGFSDRNSYIL